MGLSAHGNEPQCFIRCMKFNWVANISSSRPILLSGVQLSFDFYLWVRSTDHITRAKAGSDIYVGVPTERDFHSLTLDSESCRGAGVPHIHKLWTSWDVRPVDPYTIESPCVSWHIWTFTTHFAGAVGICSLLQFSAGFEVLTTVVVKNSVFWDIKLCHLFKVNQRFGGTCRLPNIG
jgi:hypothetical protein